jgi:hypothetical protein
MNLAKEIMAMKVYSYSCVCMNMLLLHVSVSLRRLYDAALRLARFDTRRRRHRHCNLPPQRQSRRVAYACQGRLYATYGGGR